jgi:very-short-patch-repair endonuclease
MNKTRQHRVPPKMGERARELRRESPQPERSLWRLLQSRQMGGHKFRRQHVVGPYVADFYCSIAKLAIEVDGRSHDDPAADARREAYFRAQGIHTLRVANDQVLREPEVVLDAILQALEERMRGESLSVNNTYEW